jgi:hypothetical protein
LCLCSSAWRARRTKDGAPQSQANPPASSAIHWSPSKFLEPISTFNQESAKTRNSFGLINTRLCPLDKVKNPKPFRVLFRFIFMNSVP